MRYVLACLVCLVLVLAGCQVAPTSAPAAPTTVTEEETPTEEATAEVTPSAEITATEEVSPSAEMTSTGAMTETEGMTPTEELTPTEEITSTEEMTTAAVSVPFEAVQVIVDFASESETPPHSHGGPVLVTVLEGEVTVRSEASGEETVYGVGDFFIEGIGDLLVVGNAGQENARTAAVFLLPEGASMTTVQDGTSTGDLPPGPTTVSSTRISVTESLGNFEAVQTILDLAPGAWSPPHTHGGLTLVTVLEGEVTERNEVTGEETVYGPGEFWTEEAGALHAAGNAGQENARLAALFLLPEGASLTMVEDGTSTDDLPGPTVVSSTSISATTAAE